MPRARATALAFLILLVGGALGSIERAQGGGANDLFPDLREALATFELNGDAHDTSGHGRDATLLGGSFVRSAWGEGLSVCCGGAQGLEWSAYASLLTPPVTIELVLTPTSLGCYQKLFGSNDGLDIGTYFCNGIDEYNTASGLAQADLRVGAPDHIAFLWDSPQHYTLYVNGVNEGSVTTAQTIPGPNAMFFQDDAATGRREELNAVIDAVRISSGLRTPDEIAVVSERVANGTLPAAPGSPAAVGHLHAIDITWSPPGHDGGNDILDYELFVDAGSGFVPLARTGGATSYEDAGLANGEARAYEVAAITSAGEGPRSGAVSAAAEAPPSAPTNLTASLLTAPGSTTLAWNAPANDGGAPSLSYAIERSIGSAASERIATTDARTYDDASCPILSTCTYRVIAMNEAGEGPSSNEASALGLSLPLA